MEKSSVLGWSGTLGRVWGDNVATGTELQLLQILICFIKEPPTPFWFNTVIFWRVVKEINVPICKQGGTRWNLSDLNLNINCYKTVHTENLCSSHYWSLFNQTYTDLLHHQLVASNPGISYATANVPKIGSYPLHPPTNLWLIWRAVQLPKSVTKCGGQSWVARPTIDSEGWLGNKDSQMKIKIIIIIILIKRARLTAKKQHGKAGLFIFRVVQTI